MQNPFDTPYPTSIDPDRKLRDAWEDLLEILEENFPDAEVSTDNDGQIIINTGVNK